MTSLAPRIDPTAASRALIRAQARSACTSAEAVIAQSRRLLLSCAIAREGSALICRCAWCERVQLDQGWCTPPELPPLRALAERVSHGICPDCIAELRRSGKSK